MCSDLHREPWNDVRDESIPPDFRFRRNISAAELSMDSMGSERLGRGLSKEARQGVKKSLLKRGLVGTGATRGTVSRSRRLMRQERRRGGKRQAWLPRF